MGNNIVKISFTGDLMCLREQNEAISRIGMSQERYDEIFRQVKPLFSESDFIIGNLETPVCNAEISSESINFNTPIEYLRSLKNFGFGFLSTANNHCLDRGVGGLCETIDNIDELNIGHSGTYRTKQESEDVYTTSVGGLRIGIVCGTFGTNSEVNGQMLPQDELWRVDLLKKQNKPSKIRFNPDGQFGKKMIADNVSSAAITNSANAPYIDRFISKIKKAKESADIVIVMPHVGGQYNPAPGNYTKYIVDAITRESPTLVIAGHPHVPLRFETVNNVFTAYSLGNFSFTPDTGYYIPNSLSEYGLILHSYWDVHTKELTKLSYSIVKNVVGEDGISRVVPIRGLYDSLSAIEKERLFVEAQAVASRVTSSLVQDPICDEQGISL